MLFDLSTPSTKVMDFRRLTLEDWFHGFAVSKCYSGMHSAESAQTTESELDLIFLHRKTCLGSMDLLLRKRPH